MRSDYKTIKLSNPIHKRFRVIAAKKGCTVQTLFEQAALAWLRNKGNGDAGSVRPTRSGTRTVRG